MKIREYSPLWWGKKIAAGAGMVAIVAMAGLGDAPQVEAFEYPTEPEIVKVEYVPAEPEYLGEFTITAYCGCPECCGEWSSDNPTTASGDPAVEGVTVGADWDTIPAGTLIEIDGVGQRVVQDKPASWIIEKYEGKIIDLYFSDHQAAKEFGKKMVKVYKSPEKA